MRTTTFATVLVLAIAALPAAQAASQVFVNQYGTLSLGKDQAAPFSNCDRLVSCQDLAGISLVDISVGDALDGVPNGWSIRYEVRDVGGQGYQLTTWRFCQYDGSGGLIRCDQDGSAPYWLAGSVSSATETVRIVLVSGADRDFQLRIWAGNGNF